MARIYAKALKAFWRRTREYHGLPYRAFLEREAARADEESRWRSEGATYPDAAWLTLQQK